MKFFIGLCYKGPLVRKPTGLQIPTNLSPQDAEKFFKNFTWTNTAKTTGTSTGKLALFRGNSDEANELKSMLEARQILQKGVANGIPIKLKSNDNTLHW